MYVREPNALTAHELDLNLRTRYRLPETSSIKAKPCVSGGVHVCPVLLLLALLTLKRRAGTRPAALLNVICLRSELQIIRIFCTQFF